MALFRSTSLGKSSKAPWARYRVKVGSSTDLCQTEWMLRLREMFPAVHSRILEQMSLAVSWTDSLSQAEKSNCYLACQGPNTHR